MPSLPAESLRLPLQLRLFLGIQFLFAIASSLSGLFVNVFLWKVNQDLLTIAYFNMTLSASIMFSSEVLHGIEFTAHNHDHSVVVCNTDEDGKRTMKYLQVLREKQVDGIIFTSEILKDEYYEALSAMKIPIVLVASASYRYPVPYVKVDDRQASYHATEYLVKKGHRKIAMISGTKEDPIAGTPRIEGYLQALGDYGLPQNDKHVVYGDFGYHSGYAAMEKLLETSGEITAVFAASDEMAVGALSAAFKHGIQVPEQLSIIGYDNLKISEMTIPPLTTVAQPLFEMGRKASAMVLSMIETGELVGSSIMPHTIVERSTVRALE